MAPLPIALNSIGLHTLRCVESTPIAPAFTVQQLQLGAAGVGLGDLNVLL